MNVTDFIPFLGNDTTEAPSALDQLEAILAEREATLGLTAVYGQPYPNTTQEPTIVFPYTLETQGGEDYGTGAKEFAVPDNGLEDTDAAVTQFISACTNTAPEDVNFNALTQVEGVEVGAELGDDGDVVVEMPEYEPEDDEDDGEEDDAEAADGDDSDEEEEVDA